jgi:alpha-amylase/alpha-mannosidase (GH57 family)
MSTNKVFWAPLWHIYQPPVQTKEWLVKVADESYRKIIELYSDFPDARFTLNINASLTQLLMDHGLWDVIEGFKKMAENGQLEFVSTPCFHTICPLLPEKEIIRQIKINDEINKKAFGDAYKPTGVWLPEMAYSSDIIPAIKKAGYEWVSLSGVSSNGKWSNKGFHTVKKGKYSLKVIFRDDVISLDIGFGRTDSDFVEKLSQNKGTYCFTALDGETIGHHVPFMVEGMRKTLEKIQNNPEVETLNCGEIFNKFEYLGEVDAYPSSWSTTYEDIQKGNYFPLWLEKHQEPFKTVHQLAWDHLKLLINASDVVENGLKGDRNIMKQFNNVRNLVDKSQYSCMYWWFTRDKWHRVASRFLAGLDMQIKAFNKLERMSDNKKVEKIVEKADDIREQIYSKMNNFYYSSESN